VEEWEERIWLGGVPRTWATNEPLDPRKAVAIIMVTFAMTATP